VNDLTGAWFENDPFKMADEPEGKLRALKSAADWTTNLGHPGYANPAVGEVFSTFVIPNMMANVAQGKVEPEEAVKTAADQIRKVFDAWRKRGLVQGG
jgi:multiple sugar transport system substrate-binding protein